MYNNIKNVSFSHPKTDYVVPAGKPDFINYTGIQTDGRTVTFNDNDNT